MMFAKESTRGNLQKRANARIVNAMGGKCPSFRDGATVTSRFKRGLMRTERREVHFVLLWAPLGSGPGSEAWRKQSERVCPEVCHGSKGP
jgi:hypothetical protein